MNLLLSSNTIVAATSEQVSCAVGDESVILGLRNSIYYGVNSVGASVWKLLLERERSVAELRDAVLAEYDVEKERCERDLLSLLEKMQAEGLVQVVGAAAE
jgi:hypothetical protein